LNDRGNSQQAISIIKLKSAREIRQIDNLALLNGYVSCVQSGGSLTKNADMMVGTIGQDMNDQFDIQNIYIRTISQTQTKRYASRVTRV